MLPNTRRIFGALPQRGDVVVFRWPGDRSQIWVKRVIGLPGDRIALHNGRVWINGDAGRTAAGRHGLGGKRGRRPAPAARLIETLPGGRKHTIFKLTQLRAARQYAGDRVPPGHLFVMGDNRDNSADSRVPLRAGGVGLLPVADLVGRVDGIVGSWDLGMKGRPVWTWPQGLRLSRFFSRGALNLSCRPWAHPRLSNESYLERRGWTVKLGMRLPHHARNAARLVPRARDLVLEIAARGRPI